MCRNIRTLFNFDPPATEEEIRAASIQFVRKLSGFTKPSKANEAAFDEATDEVAAVARRLIDSLVTTAEPRDREEWAARAKQRAAERFARQTRAVNGRRSNARRACPAAASASPPPGLTTTPDRGSRHP